MASIQQRSNGRWAVRWRDEAGRQHWRTFATKKAAEEFLRPSVTFARVASPPTALKVNVETYATEWKGRQLWRPGTQSQVDCYLRRYLIPQFGRHDLSAIRTADVQVFVRQLADHLAPASVRLIIAHLRSLMNEAVRDGLITTNPTKGVRLPRQHRAVAILPTLQQVSTLRSQLPDRYRTLVDLAAGSGLRQGECLGLTLDRLDPDALTIRVDRQLAQPALPGSLFGPPKTHASIRVVPITATLVEALQGHADVFGLGPDRLLFTDESGEPLKRRTVSQVWSPAARTVGLPPRTGMHCLRHFYASLLIRAGCSVKVVQSRLGHATAAETLDTYAHIWPDDEDRTRLALGAVGL